MLTKRKDGRYVKTITVNGKRVYFYSVEPTQKKAEKDIDRQMMEYKEQEEKGKLFSYVADEWDREHSEKVQYTTQIRYKKPFKMATDEFGDRYIKEISPQDVEKYVNKCVCKNYSQKSVKMCLSVLSMIFKYAYIREYIKSNPCMYVTIPKGLAKNTRQPLSEQEIEIVKNSCSCTFGLFAYLLLFSGLRRGEALALCYEDIDRQNKIISISKSVYYKSNKPCIKTPKTEAGRREVILLDVLLEKLPNTKKGYIFSNSDGKLLGNSKVTRLWEKYKKETNLNITPHQLRHTYATFLYEAGVTDKDAQDLMGHADITTTKNIYTHISKRKKQSTAEQLNQYLAAN